MSATAWSTSLLRSLPEGRELPEADWATRHQAIVGLVFLHAAGLILFGFYQGFGLGVSYAEGSLVAALGAVACWRRLGRRFRSAVASVALVTASAVAVHFSHGAIEAHFHFFVMLAVISLYQDWVPFLIAIGYVALDHGIVGSLYPAAVYNHPDAVLHPWKWALIHASLVLGESAALLAGWRAAENWREKTQAVLDAASDGIVGTDLEGTITFANPAMSRLTGVPVAGLQGRAITDFLDGGDVGRATQAAVGASGVHAPVFHTSDHGLRATDGRVTTVDWVAAPVSKHGHATGLVYTVKDVTERRQVEAVKARALEREKEAAEAATRTKSEFLANMSHEIRTPLNAVIGMTGLLATTPLDGEQREYVDTVRGSGEHLLTLINDILDFSKIEAGMLELEAQPYDLRTVLEESLDLVAPRAAEKGLEIAYVLEEDVPGVLLGDGPRIRQILVNLLSNGVKFTAKGEVIVTARAQKIDGDRHEVHFAVSDTGIGIPKDRFEKLFKSFSQVDSSTTRTFGGTGLGLAISKRLAELMGGRVWCESEVGTGSTFHFTVVARESSALQKRDLTASGDVRGLRLLIVDDNATNRRILSAQAISWGLVPCALATPEEALAYVRRGERFDVVALDYQMPSMDGVQLAREIRKVHSAESLPILLLSSLGRRPTDAHAPDVAISSVLTKPVKQSALYDALVEAVARVPGSRRATAVVEGTRETQTVLPLKILLVEDNATNRFLATKVLDKMGYRVDVAENGREAIEALERATYDVVLMDVQMPVLDGLEATREIVRRWAAGARPRIVAMTAHAMEKDRRACIEAGMDDYISKPINVKQLSAALARCRVRSSGGEAAL